MRYLLFPFVPIYYLITWVRNSAYDIGVFSSKTYNFPVICVGNLSVGGTGKTPMIEYLIRLLKPDNRIATLSRGYKRSTKGFVLANEKASALSIGDEPFQFYNKFKDLIVGVDGDRVNGINHLRQLESKPDVILLDDAFQHRKVKAGLNILLTPYNDLYVNDFVLPTGNLREPKRGADRAQIIVVTKCPDTLAESTKAQVVKSLAVKPYQKVVFSWVAYSQTIKNNHQELPLTTLKQFTLVTGIANPQPLTDYLNSQNVLYKHLKFKDHHVFTATEVAMLKQQLPILTTEKDYVRLAPHFSNDEALYYLPIETRLDAPDDFKTLVTDFVNSYH